MITVVNRRTYTGPWDETVVYVGRPTPLGNPFTHLAVAHTKAEHHVATREEAISSYRVWLRTALRVPFSEGRVAFQTLVDLRFRHGHLTLVCWCAPLPCHAHVLAEEVMRWIEGPVHQ